MGPVSQTLSDREATYGSYDSQATFAQAIKELLRSSPGWAELPPVMREALDMIATKQSRILHGDPRHIDSWHDIAGYSTLVEQLLVKM